MKLEFNETKAQFTDQNSQPLEIEDRMNRMNLKLVIK